VAQRLLACMLALDFVAFHFPFPMTSPLVDCLNAGVPQERQENQQHGSN
jgi:hypothetical protein